MTRRTGTDTSSTMALLLFGASALMVPSSVQARQVTQGSGDYNGPVVQGVVTDAESGTPLETGSVALYGARGEQFLTVFTDAEGHYILQTPAPGAYSLRAERVGYHPDEQGPFSVRGGDTLTVDFQLSPAPLLLDSILVSVERAGRPLRAGEQLVYGRLLDDETGEPIPQGLIRLLQESGTAASTLSDDEGLFWLVSPNAGTYRLQGERIGYQTSTGPELYLMLGDTLGVDFYLSVDAVLLNPIVVRATARALGARYDLRGMGGFLNRYSRFSKAGFGDFLTRDSLAKYEDWGLSTAQILGEKSMNARFVEVSSGQVILKGGCVPTYFLEGTPMPPGYPLWSLTPEMLEAVEVYASPEIPAEFFRSGFPCGVVSFWYRREPDTRPPIPWWKKTMVGAGLLSLSLIFIL